MYRLESAKCYYKFYALVVQRIGHELPKLRIGVRFLSRAPTRKCHPARSGIRIFRSPAEFRKPGGTLAQKGEAGIFIERIKINIYIETKRFLKSSAERKIPLEGTEML